MNLTIAIAATLLLGAFYSWTSRINGMFFFGRTVSSDLQHSDAGEFILRQYRVAVLFAVVLAVVLAWAGSHLGRSFAAIGLFAEWLACSLIFARANHQVQRLEQQRGTPANMEAIVQVTLMESPSYWVPSVAAIFAPLATGLLCLAIAVLVSGNRSDLSARWTSLTNSVEAHGWSEIVGMAMGMWAVASSLLLLFRSSARLRTNMAQYTVRASVVMQWIAVALLAGILLCNYLGLTLQRSMEKSLVLVAVLGALLTVVVNQTRSRRFVPPSAELGGDNRWRWGLFYFDRADPALFVQSRCGAGYSLNFGRALAWPITLAVLGYFVTMLFLPPHH